MVCWVYASMTSFLRLALPQARILGRVDQLGVRVLVGFVIEGMIDVEHVERSSWYLGTRC